MLRVGVACEGPTDFIAIKTFVEAKMNSAESRVEVISIQPDMDNTRRDAGWGNLLNWLLRIGPEARVLSYFGGGLFESVVSAKRCDVLLLQMDTDILGEKTFSEFVRKHFNLVLGSSDDPAARSILIGNVLTAAAALDRISEKDRRRHLLCPAVEATETWCLSAFSRRTDNPEELRSEALVNAFMQVLERSEGREARSNYTHVDKSVKRRKAYCDRHSTPQGVGWLVASCSSFRSLCEQLENHSRI